MPKKKKLSRFQYQNKKGLFTDPIFSEGFDDSKRRQSVTSDTCLQILDINTYLGWCNFQSI